MALAIEVDSLDGVDEGIQSLYQKTDEGKFRLDVDLTGYEHESDVQALKNALGMEKDSNKSLKEKLQELETEQERIAREAAEKSGEYKNLYEQEKEKGESTQAELNKLKSNLKDGAQNGAASSVAALMTRDSTRQELAAEKAKNFVEVDDDFNAVYKIDGKEVTAEQVAEHLSKKYDFLADGSGSSGGGAPGGQGGGAVGDKKASEMSQKEKNDFIDEHGSEAYRKKVQQEQRAAA